MKSKEKSLKKITHSKGKSSKKIRPIGDVLLDLEDLLLEMVDTHDLQWGEILNLIRGYLEIHCPEAKEVYLDGSSPMFYYGCIESMKGDQDSGSS